MHLNLLTVPMWYFCCGSMLPVFGASRVSFHLMCVHIIFISVCLFVCLCLTTHQP